MIGAAAAAHLSRRQRREAPAAPSVAVALVPAHRCRQPMFGRPIPADCVGSGRRCRRRAGVVWCFSVCWAAPAGRRFVLHYFGLPLVQQSSFTRWWAALGVEPRSVQSAAAAATESGCSVLPQPRGRPSLSYERRAPPPCSCCRATARSAASCSGVAIYVAASRGRH